MAVKHGNGVANKSYTVCSYCGTGHCEQCLDVLRSRYASDRICTCKKRGHDEAVREASHA